MILYLLGKFVLGVISILISFLPVVTELPTIGTINTQDVLITFAGYMNGIVEYIWPLEIVWTCTIWYFSISVILTVARFFFGNRIPQI